MSVRKTRIHTAEIFLNISVPAGSLIKFVSQIGITATSRVTIKTKIAHAANNQANMFLRVVNFFFEGFLFS